jgi:hypothetical protein
MPSLLLFSKVPAGPASPPWWVAGRFGRGVRQHPRTVSGSWSDLGPLHAEFAANHPADVA